MRRRIRLTEGDLRRIVSKSVKRVLRESIDSVSPDPFGTNTDEYHEQSQKDAMFFDKLYPWRKNPDCNTVDGLIAWGAACARDFESGKLSIRNFLNDLDRMANG